VWKGWVDIVIFLRGVAALNLFNWVVVLDIVC
jgi:hypothetical protein